MNDVLESTERMIALSRELDAREAEMALAALQLAPTPGVFAALRAGDIHVPRAALHEDWRDRLVCWDGRLTAAIARDVALMLEVDRAAGDIEESGWKPRVAGRAA